MGLNWFYGFVLVFELFSIIGVKAQRGDAGLLIQGSINKLKNNEKLIENDDDDNSDKFNASDLYYDDGESGPQENPLQKKERLCESAQRCIELCYYYESRYCHAPGRLICSENTDDHSMGRSHHKK